ncbi:SDR family NAD(P)-dependent oxidoreductase [Rhodanobacter sp. BL-MT-08]
MFRYFKSTALITGASEGLGAAYARELAARGTSLVLVARSLTKLEELAHSVRALHSVGCVAICCDLSDSDAVSNLMLELEWRKLKIDLLINNAGLGLTGNFLAHDLEKEQRSIQLNVRALVSLSHALGSQMILRGRGGIINIASNASFQPLPFMATYAAAKAFSLHFTEALRYELQGHGVQVMAVCPGPTATKFFEGTMVTMKETAFDSAEYVARRTLQAFDRKKTIAYPGRFSVRPTTWLPRFMPRDLITKVAASAMKKMGLAK